MNEEAVQKLRWIEDKDSDGFMDKPDPPFLFQEVTRLVNGGEGAQKAAQIKDALLPWDSFKSIVVRHESEWYLTSTEKPFLDDLLEKYTHPMMSDIIDHEKQRIDQLVWMQEENKINFERLVWHWWPLMESPGLVSFDMIKAITNNLNDNYILNLVSSLNLNLSKYGVNTKL
ncbi:hypothetical protein P4S72_04355 [Vibrio sp. PP-XX7]